MDFFVSGRLNLGSASRKSDARHFESSNIPAFMAGGPFAFADFALALPFAADAFGFKAFASAFPAGRSGLRFGAEGLCAV